MCYYKGREIPLLILKLKSVVFLVESKRFVQHSVDVKGEHRHSGWRSHWASITVSEKDKRLNVSLAPEFK